MVGLIVNVIALMLAVQAGGPLAKREITPSKSGKIFEQAYMQYCKGEVATADSVLKDYLSRNPNDPKAFFLLNGFLPERNEKFVDGLLLRIKNGEQPGTEMDRLMFVYALVQSRNQDFARIKALLSFTSNIVEIEGDRLLWNAWLSQLEGRSEQAFLESEEAFRLLGDGVGEPLLNLSGLKVNNEELKKRQKNYTTQFRLHLAEGNPYRHMIDAQIAYLNGQDGLYDIQQGYLVCPVDQYLASAYASYLESNAYHEYRSWMQDRADEKRKKAVGILRDIIAKRKYYEPYVDIQLANAIIAMNKGAVGFFANGEVEGALGRAKAASFYLEPQTRNALQELEKYVDQQHWKQRIAVAIILLFIIGIVFLIQRSLRKSRNVKKDELVENSIELAEAETAAKSSDSIKRVQIASFDSTHGYKHQDLIEMTLYLGEQGIAADYTTTNTVGIPEAGGMEVYSLRVPVDQVTEAKRLLKKRNK